MTVHSYGYCDQLDKLLITTDCECFFLQQQCFSLMSNVLG